MTQCQATPSGSGCDVILAQQADVTALIQSTGAFTTRVETLYGMSADHPGQSLVPECRPGQQAIYARIQAMVAQYGQVPSIYVNYRQLVGAGGPPALRDLQFLLATAGYDTLGLVGRTLIGDVPSG